MSLVSAEEISAKAVNAYSRFLKQWLRGEDGDFFPHRVRARLSIDSKNPKATIAASEKLLAKSKPNRGWGYTVHRQQVRTRDFGSNLIPKSITIDTLDDLLRLANKVDEFRDVCFVVDQIRSRIPQLNEWLISHVQSVHSVADSMEGLILVAQYFVDNPWPDCYARQIPVPVDTKFIERHQTTLRQWLDLLLPSSAIDVNESKFSRRFGLRDGQPHRGIRLLDPRLLNELGLPFDELSLPIRSIANLSVKDTTVFVVENNLILLSLPAFERGISIRGEGNAVNRLGHVSWLESNRVFYWGDIDVDGFLILSRLRNLFPHVESMMMDRETMSFHNEYVVAGNGSTASMPTNLTTSESSAFAECLQQNRRLEQEKILQPYVEQTLERL